ncbi:unnamed protein product [Ixodes persulcatus]
MAHQRPQPKSRFSEPPHTSRPPPSTPDQAESHGDPIMPPAYCPFAYYMPVMPPVDPSAAPDPGDSHRSSPSPHAMPLLPPFLKSQLAPAPHFPPAHYLSGYRGFPVYQPHPTPLYMGYETVFPQPMNTAVTELLERAAIAATAKEREKWTKRDTTEERFGFCRTAFFMTTLLMALFVGATFSYYMVSAELAERDLTRWSNLSDHVIPPGFRKRTAVIPVIKKPTTSGRSQTKSSPVLSFYLHPRRNGSLDEASRATVRSRARTQRCQTQLCDYMTDRFKASLNWSISPCEDFYDFVCSSWRTKGGASLSQDALYSEQVEARLKRLVFDSETNNTTDNFPYARQLLDMCVKDDNTTDSEKHKNQSTHLRRFLAQLGLESWPYQNESASRVDMWRTNVLMHRHLGIFPLLAVTVEKDPDNETNKLIAIDEPDLLIGLFGTRDTFLPNWYFKVVRAAMKLFSSYKYLTYSDKVLSFSEKLAEITSTRGQRNYAEEAKITTVHNLASYAQFLGLLFDDITTLTDKTKVLVKNMRYLKALKSLVHATQNPDLLNYLGFRAVLHVSPLLFGEEFAELATIRMRQLTGVRQLRWPRWRSCLRTMEDAMPFVYQRELFKAIGKKVNNDRIIALLNDLKNNLLLAVSNFTWMSAEDKVHSKNILADVKLEVFYPSWIKAESDDFYAALLPTPRNGTDTSLLEVYMDFTRKAAEQKLLSIASLESRPQHQWQGSIFDTYPVFDYETRTVYVPLATFNLSLPDNDAALLLQTPRLSTRVMASLIASLHRNSYPIPEQPWLLRTTEDLKSVETCLEDQYKGISNTMHDDKVRSRVTTKLDFLDNAAMEPALAQFRKYVVESGVVMQQDALNLPLSTGQLFHILYTAELCESGTSEQLRQELTEDAFTQPKLRVIVPLRNMQSFARAWHCNLEDPMNPADKCTLWS